MAELPLGLAAWVFGSAGANLVVVACTVTALVAFAATMRRYGVGGSGLVIAAVLANGYVLIAGATSMDYMVAFAAFSAGLYALACGADVLGVVLLATSVGARIFYVVLAEFAVVFVLIERRATGRGATAGQFASYSTATFFVAGLFYLPVWFDHGLRLDWLGAARPIEQGWAGLVARAVYKTIMFVGVAGMAGAGLGWLALDARRRRNRVEPSPSGRSGESRSRRAFVLFSAGVVAAHLALFVWIPIDASYLIPALPFAAAILASVGLRGALIGLAAGELLTTLVVFDPLTIVHPARDLCGRSHASGLHLRPRLTPGLLLEDAHRRPLAPGCGEQVLLFRPPTPTSPLPAGDPGRIYPRTPPIELAPDW